MLNNLRYLKLISALGLALVCGTAILACSPSIRPTFDLSSVAIEAKAPSKVRANLPPIVYVDDFRDTRPAERIIVKGVEESKPASDITSLVRQSLRRSLEQSGFTISDSAPLIISGEIREWLVTITTGVPARASSDAKVYIEVFDPANKRIYQGTYEGYSEISHPSLGNDDIRRSLSISMSEVLKQILEDRDLNNILQSF